MTKTRTTTSLYVSQLAKIKDLARRYAVEIGETVTVSRMIGEMIFVYERFLNGSLVERSIESNNEKATKLLSGLKEKYEVVKE